jgi:uncharacterized protein (TIGR00369 family)
MSQLPADPRERILDRVRALMTSQIPFHRVLGIEVLELAPGHARFAVPFRPELIGDPDRPALHGGVLSAVADAAGGCAVWTMVGETDRISTIDLRIDYLRPARLETFHATATVLRVGNRVGVATIVLTHPTTPGELVAEAKGVYSIKRAGDSHEHQSELQRNRPGDRSRRGEGADRR